MAEFRILKLSWPWPWPLMGSYDMAASLIDFDLCIHIKFLKNFLWTDGRTDIDREWLWIKTISIATTSILGSRTDPISLRILYSCSSSCCCWKTHFKKFLRLRRFKSDRDGIWHDCSLSKCALTDVFSILVKLKRWPPRSVSKIIIFWGPVFMDPVILFFPVHTVTTGFFIF